MAKFISRPTILVRLFSDQQRFSFAPRTVTTSSSSSSSAHSPTHHQHSMAEDAQEGSDADFGRRAGMASVSMHPPHQRHSRQSSQFQSMPFSAAIFPEEVGQVYSINDFPGLGMEPFSSEIANILQTPIAIDDVEVKPDGAIYLPEVKYRKILNQAFGAGGWALIPRGPHSLNGSTLSREYALFCQSRFMSQARGSSLVQGQSSPAASTEAVRSNALMRCCKDLGIASELWDRNYVMQWRDRFATKKTINDKFGNSKVVWVKSSGSNN